MLSVIRFWRLFSYSFHSACASVNLFLPSDFLFFRNVFVFPAFADFFGFSIWSYFGFLNCVPVFEKKDVFLG